MDSRDYIAYFTMEIGLEEAMPTYVISDIPQPTEAPAPAKAAWWPRHGQGGPQWT